MNKTNILVLLCAFFCSCTGSHKGNENIKKMSGNSIITHMYTADPSARVFNDTLWIYPSHDPDNATWFDMIDYHVFSTTDMVNYTDHGVALHLDDITWAEKYAWAPDAIERKGVIFDPVNSGTNHHSIVEYKGQWYFFYHNSDLYFQNTPDEEPVLNWDGINPFRRSVCVDYLYYNSDGTIQKVIPTKEGVRAIK